MYFQDLKLSDDILDGLDSMNFFETTPIQEATIPLLLDGHDMIACAQTGTGKTAAYLLPIMQRISQGEGAKDKVNALIIAPTRELAIQIDQQVQAFGYHLSISSVAIYGGGDGITFAQQERSLNLGVDIVIATPGRLLSMLNLGSADFSGVSYFVLDEADRMLDMGFVGDILQIHKLLPEDVQTVMFSATMPPKIKTLAKDILRNPKEVEIAISKPPESILQEACICYEGQKLNILKHFFKEYKPERTIIFSSKKANVRELATKLRKVVPKVAEMHSDLGQEEREKVMRDFKSGEVDLLIATDIVARGIDVDNINMVINYEVPRDPEDYVHRIGRTARGESEGGRALMLVGEAEQYDMAFLERFLGKPLQHFAVPEELGKTPEYKGIEALKKKNKGGRKSNFKGRKNSGKPQQNRNKSAKPKGKSGQRKKQDKSTNNNK